MLDPGVFLKRITFLREQVDDADFPFSIPAFQNLEFLELSSPVTFLVGENGSGKSTLLEAVAYQCGFNTAGGSRNNLFDTAASDAALGEHIRLSWLPKVTQGFFLRAETFHQFATHIDRLGPGATAPYGDRSLHHQSHGEAFTALFVNRFGKKGIYLLDEPEAALSPSRQLAFMRIMWELLQEGQSQFVIATHSPILMAYPGARILSFDTAPLSEIQYQETEHYQVTMGFLADPERYLQRLLGD